MIIHAHTLHIDGTVTKAIVDMPRYRKASSALVTYGTQARKADPTVAAIRSSETGDHYQWIGHYTPEHMAAINAAGSGW